MIATPKTDAFVAALRARGVVVLEHDDWGARQVDVYRRRLDTHRHALLPSKPVDTIWHHITVTFDHGPLSGDFKADLRTVEGIGFQRFGSGISYNILVDANSPFPRVALGQFLEAKGTHTVNDKDVPGFSHDQNAVALGIAWIGMPGDALNAAAVEAIVQAEAALIEVGACTTTYDCVPHSLVAAKDCPTDELRDRLPQIRSAALAAATPPKPRVFRVQHRIVTANMYVNNPASDARVSGPLAGMHQIIARVKSAFRFAPDVIAVQEGHRMLPALEDVAGYNLFDDRTDGEASKEIPALVLDPYRVSGTEYHHAADGIGSGAFDHERGITITKYVKRARKVAVVNTHMGLIADEDALEDGTKRVGAAAAEHAAHAQKVARTYLRLKANGYLVFVTADANARGVWAESLPAVLQAAGMQVTQHGVDLIAHDPSLVRVKQVTTVGHRLTGSDAHDALAVRYIEKRKP